MNFLLIIVCCCIFLNVEAKSKLSKCIQKKTKGFEHMTYRIGYVCTSIACDWSIDSTCKNGTYSKVLKWETDIFEIGFRSLTLERAREVVVQIKLNDDYYIQIDVNSDKENRNVTIILNECSRTKNCFENRRETHENLTEDYTYIAIGFRKDKKINFVTVSKGSSIATNLFGPDNEYELKMPGFYFNTSETMYITVYSKFDAKYPFKGVLMYLPTSVGGIPFNASGYLSHDDGVCPYYYTNNDERTGISYIYKEYFNSSENWKAHPVNHTIELKISYFDENGMKLKQEEMHVKEVKNPNFDAKKMERKGCKYVEKENISTEPDITETTTTESTSTEDETTETTTTRTTLTENEVTKSTKPYHLTKKSVLTLRPPTPNLKDQLEDSLTDDQMGGSLNEGGEITINQTVLIPKHDPSEPNLDLKEFLKLVGEGSLYKDYLKNGGIERNNYNVQLKNGSFVNLKTYKLKNPPKKQDKRKDTKKKKGGSGGSGGSGGAGDASRGEKQVKIISSKYFVILILMILSV